MRIAISSQGDTPESRVDPRFGRTSVFLIVDTENMAFETIKTGYRRNVKFDVYSFYREIKK